jgi:hypothetical protein
MQVGFGDGVRNVKRVIGDPWRKVHDFVWMEWFLKRAEDEDAFEALVLYLVLLDRYACWSVGRTMVKVGQVRMTLCIQLKNLPFLHVKGSREVLLN